VGKFSKFDRFEVGVELKVSFWHDIWCVDRSLKISYPDLFSIAQRKDPWVADNMQFRDEIIQWDIIFTRQVPDWEVEMVLSFFERLYSLQLRHGEEDRIGWSPSNRS
jgi:hypothetical protein